MSTEVDELRAQLNQLLQREKERDAKQGKDERELTADAIRDHLAVRAATLPLHDFGDLGKRAEELTVPLNADKTESFLTAVRTFIRRNGPVAHELAYVEGLAEDLHQYALDDKANAPKPTAEPAPKPEEDTNGED